MPEIIETYWNVNFLTVNLLNLKDAEIIETYWNVNFLTVNLLNLKDAEIIETYWNVNSGRIIYCL